MIIKKQRDAELNPVNHPGKPISKLVYIENGQIPHVTQIATVILVPHDHISVHAHTDMYECFFILNGSCTAIINSNAIQLEQQDFICIEPQENHELTNVSDKNTTLLYWSFQRLLPAGRQEI